MECVGKKFNAKNLKVGQMIFQQLLAVLLDVETEDDYLYG